MATVPGPPVVMSDVRAVFGAPPGTRLFDFGRGGPWVPDVPQNANVPTYGNQIRLAQLAGATNYQPQVISGPSSRTWSGVNNRPPISFTVGSAQSVGGGTNAFTVHWDRISGDTGITCDNAASAGSTFRAYGGLLSDDIVDITAVWRLTVNDGVQSIFKDVTFHFTASA